MPVAAAARFDLGGRLHMDTGPMLLIAQTFQPGHADSLVSWRTIASQASTGIGRVATIVRTRSPSQPRHLTTDTSSPLHALNLQLHPPPRSIPPPPLPHRHNLHARHRHRLRPPCRRRLQALPKRAAARLPSCDMGRLRLLPRRLKQLLALPRRCRLPDPHGTACKRAH